MASVLTRLLAALRGSVVASPAGRDALKYQPQVRVRQRQSASAPVESPVDRNTSMSGLRVKRLRGRILNPIVSAGCSPAE